MKLKIVIDRFEGDNAVVLLDESATCFAWPRAYLPPGAAEGDHLTISLTIDKKATRSARQEAKDLLRQLLEANEK